MLANHSEILYNLNLLYQKLNGSFPNQILPLPKSGSSRLYYRLISNDTRAIGVYNPEINENKAFFNFTYHFKSKGINTPELLIKSDDNEYYLLSDLGDLTLFSIIEYENKYESYYTDGLINLLKSSIYQLVDIQTDGYEGFNPKWCYPKSEFDKRSVIWDFSYFKYSFLKPSGILFDEGRLEDDFEEFTKYLLDDDMSYFHYRDFQSRNIMVVNDELYFIDYQGGRVGPCLYDLASFLYQAKASFPDSIRQELIEDYFIKLRSKRKINESNLRERFPAFVLFRIIQTLGAYGYRGNFEKKSHFLLSIPLAVKNLKTVLESNIFKFKADYLHDLLLNIYEKYNLNTEQNILPDVLKVELTSFSFKNGYPESNPEHGGGFIFDCRALPNPGRILEYKILTGIDEEVIDYFKNEPEVEAFIDKTFSIINDVITNYLDRKFKYLSIGFGCTGGQHRSVYCTEMIAERLKTKKGIVIKVKHREIITNK